MSKINDGGPAFPDADGQANYTGGMTLRDYFAGQALAATIRNMNGATDNEFLSIAQSCYAMADAMLAARKEPTR